MKTKQQLQKDLQAALRWEPLLNVAEIGLTGKDCCYINGGTVDCCVLYSEDQLGMPSLNFIVSDVY